MVPLLIPVWRASSANCCSDPHRWVAGALFLLFHSPPCPPTLRHPTTPDHPPTPPLPLPLGVQDTGGRGSVQSVSVMGSTPGATWQPMNNVWGAAWEVAAAPTPPLSFRITCDDGSSVVANDVIKQNGGISGQTVDFSTDVNFAVSMASTSLTAGGAGAGGMQVGPGC